MRSFIKPWPGKQILENKAQWIVIPDKQRTWKGEGLWVLSTTDYGFELMLLRLLWPCYRCLELTLVSGAH